LPKVLRLRHRTDIGSEWRRSMKNLLFPASVMIFAALAATPVVAQQRVGTPFQRPNTITPPVQRPNIITPPGSVSLSTPGTSPLQQQMQTDYATQLRQAQTGLLQQNSSGQTRPEMGISRSLNGFTPQ
jgi:hypothetical protein